MTLALLGTLAVLALIDSTSFGTLLIPIWLMLAPGRLRAGRVVLFLATVALFYLALGVALTAGVAAYADHLTDLLEVTAVQVVLLVVGIAMVLLAIRMHTSPRTEEPGRLDRWRRRAVGDEGTATGLMLLAVTAALIEAGSMVPYLGAIGLIGTADLSWPVILLTLAGYCMVMILPALLLLAARVAAAHRVEPVLKRINGWMVRNSRTNLACILGIIGFVIATNAAGGLGITG
ncbi:GAP family protein [Aeromicrobium sp. NPDC092404]|uniref:GAP family protein n=1 Tax=Aeromicrobium sp. NPDC092404 TaxID=3154976 RepID=UPI003429C65E